MSDVDVSGGKRQRLQLNYWSEQLLESCLEAPIHVHLCDRATFSRAGITIELWDNNRLTPDSLVATAAIPVADFLNHAQSTYIGGRGTSYGGATGGHVPGQGLQPGPTAGTQMGVGGVGPGTATGGVATGYGTGTGIVAGQSAGYAGTGVAGAPAGELIYSAPIAFNLLPAGE